MDRNKCRESENSGGGLFFKLEDGDSLTGVCRGEIFEFCIVWENNRSRVVEKDDEGAKARFRLNIVVNEGGRFVAKIWEFGLTIYNQLADIAEEYDISKTKLKITRRGTGTDTIYMILPLLKEPLQPKDLKSIEAVSMQILEHREKQNQNNGPEPKF